MPSKPSTKPQDERRVAFVISPIGAPGTEHHRRFKLSLDYIIRKALEPDWHVVRADQESTPDSITHQVIERIIKSDLIVADMTDHNANVFYEIAVAHGHQRPVVHLIQEGQTPPFDLGDQRAILYDLTNPASVDEAISRLRDAASHVGQPDYRAQNPLTQYGQFAAIRGFRGTDDAGEAVADALEQVSRQVSSLTRRVADLASTSMMSETAAVDSAHELKRVMAELREIDRELHVRTKTFGELDADDPMVRELLRRKEYLRIRAHRLGGE